MLVSQDNVRFSLLALPPGESRERDLSWQDLTAVSDLSGHALVNGQPRERHISGLNDPRFRVSVNLYGAPALSKQEFASYKQDLIVGASLQVSPPLGQYEPDRLVNLGTNRWFFKPELGLSKALGPFTLELSAAAFFFTDNDDSAARSSSRTRKVYSADLIEISGNSARINIRGDSGLYIKELISGDGGRTKPNLSEALNVDAVVVEFDVMDVGGESDGTSSWNAKEDQR